MVARRVRIAHASCPKENRVRIWEKAHCLRLVSIDARTRSLRGRQWATLSENEASVVQDEGRHGILSLHRVAEGFCCTEALTSRIDSSWPSRLSWNVVCPEEA